MCHFPFVMLAQLNSKDAVKGYGLISYTLYTQRADQAVRNSG